MLQASNNTLEPLNRTVAITDHLGKIGLYIFAFGAWLHKGVAIAGLCLMILACLQDRKAIQETFRHSPLVWITAITGFYILARTILSLSTDSIHATLHLKDGLRFFYLCGFLLIGWHMAASQKRILSVFALGFCGFLFARLWYFDWSFSSSIPWWQIRQGLGLPEIAFGYYAATAMSGLVIFLPRVYSSFRSITSRTVASLIWVLLYAMAVQGIVLSQSRSVWASLLAITPVLLFALWEKLKSVKHTGKRALLFMLVSSVLLSSTGALVYLNSNVMQQRVELEQETYVQLLSGNLEEITTTDKHGQTNNVGARLLLFKTGIEHWLENPLFGKGPAASKILLKKSNDPVFIQLNDWHNGPIDILVRYGLTGLLLLSICLWLTLQAGWRAYRQKRIDRDLFLFLACGMLLILLSMLTNFRMLNYDWRYWIFMFSGAFASFELHKQMKTGPSAEGY